MAKNVYGEPLPRRIKAADVNVRVTTEVWQLPEVGQPNRRVGLHAKKEKQDEVPDTVSVVEEEIVAEKLTLAELDAIREEARQEGFEVGRQAGYDVGFEQGDSEGQAQGLRTEQQRIDAQVQRVQALLATLDMPLQAQQDQLAQLVTEMAIAVAQTTVAHEVVSNPQIIQQAVSEAISALPEPTGELVVYVASDDFAVAQAFAEQQPGRITVAADASMAVGSCKVATDTSVVDYCMEQRFAQVAEQVRLRLADQLNHPDQGTSHEPVTQPE